MLCTVTGWPLRMLSDMARLSTGQELMAVTEESTANLISTA